MDAADDQQPEPGAEQHDGDQTEGPGDGVRGGREAGQGARGALAGARGAVGCAEAAEALEASGGAWARVLLRARGAALSWAFVGVAGAAPVRAEAVAESGGGTAQAAQVPQNDHDVAPHWARMPMSGRGYAWR
ncbi:hypothetical protein GCM10018785_22110 [Streptomyces longispororuber]|uniref:Uncharacterized protein n=1 Tax=Streptomyces longispororuber TaxID=68230 RepID=A0A919DJQ4_9ACTN|nr:hypothetical protein GCM10018785_22110 [Streptomyces longispororuber]